VLITADTERCPLAGLDEASDMASSERRNGTTHANDSLMERPSWSSGIIPGLAGGFVMALVLMALSATQRPGPLAPFPLIASLVIGTAATGLVGVVTGLAVHTLFSGLLGALFARIAGYVPRRYLLGLGVLFALNVWAAVQFIVLPLMNPEIVSPTGVVWPFLVGHLAYGLMLAASLPVAAELEGNVLVRTAMLPPTVAARVVVETTGLVKDVVVETTGLVKDAVDTVASELPSKDAATRALLNATDKVQETMKDVVDSVLPEPTPKHVPVRK
jgi:hypothetical protein